MVTRIVMPNFKSIDRVILAIPLLGSIYNRRFILKINISFKVHKYILETWNDRVKIFMYFGKRY